jgi:hypothetical protein
VKTLLVLQPTNPLRQVLSVRFEVDLRLKESSNGNPTVEKSSGSIKSKSFSEIFNQLSEFAIDSDEELDIDRFY